MMTETSTVIYGLDEDYHNIDISEVKGSGVGDDFHLVPTQSKSPSPTSQTTSTAVPELNADSLEFIESTADSGGEVTGSVDTSSQLQEGTKWGSLKHQHVPGKAASYFESKGFGWLLEVEDEEEDAKPLL